jgi:hypothetical protein
MNTPTRFDRLGYGIAALLAAMCMSLLTSGAASAHGYYGHGYGYGHYGHYGRYGYGPGFGIVIGAPYWGYYPYAPPPYPYGYPPAVAVPQSPPVYVEQGQPAPPPQAQAPQAPPAQVWYFCPGENGYYPYVRQCPGGWQTVPAQPPPSPPH